MNSGDVLKRSSSHLTALDGVRGVAILLVLATHLIGGGRPTHWNEPGTWFFNFLLTFNTGVDLFFVLSGVLITGILLDTRGSKSYFWNFYARRGLRIFPLYYATVAAYYIYFFHCGRGAPAMERLPWVLAYCVNIRSWMKGYMDFTIAHVSMDHFWSLSVEEQFYLLWPAIVLITDHRTLRKICYACVVISASTRLMCVYHNPQGVAALTLLTCRSDCFAVGALVALELREGGGHLSRNAKKIFIISAAAFAICCFDCDIYVAFIHATTPWLYGSLIVAAICKPEVGRHLSNPILRSFGKFSYAIYMFHVPILGMVKLHEPTWPAWETAFVTLVLTCIASVVSWHLIEAPFIRLKAFFPHEASLPTSRDLALSLPNSPQAALT